MHKTQSGICIQCVCVCVTFRWGFLSITGVWQREGLCLRAGLLRRVCGDLLDLAVAAPPPSFSRLFHVNYVKGFSYGINDIPLFSECVCGRVWSRDGGLSLSVTLCQQQSLAASGYSHEVAEFIVLMVSAADLVVKTSTVV